jgi:hypothetical protein
MAALRLWQRLLGTRECRPDAFSVILQSVGHALRFDMVHCDLHLIAV